MGTDVSIVMCYRHFGDPWREQSFLFTRPWYEKVAADLGFQFVLDTSEGGHAKAINSGVRTADGDVIVLVDSDSLVPADRITAAVELARTPGLVVPHDRYVYLSQFATTLVLRGGLEPFDLRHGQFEFAGGSGVGNVVVFSRETWQTAGGYDERFYAWGGDDTCFHFACEAFCAPTRRIPGDVVHLWHVRTPEEARGHRPTDIQIVLDAYEQAARTGPEAVRELVNSR